MERFLIGAESEILVGRGIPDPLLPANESRRRVAVLTQPGAVDVAERVAARIAAEGAEPFLHVMPDGDDAKTLPAVESAYTWLADRQIGRTDTLVAVGGGAVTDAGGFVAATWMRGIEAVYVPTTLLGAVDAAVGGKTGINVGGKNLVGVFRHPRRVVVDLDVLEALPSHLKREGAAEIVKAGLLAAPDVVTTYRERGIDAPLEEVVPAAIAVKVDIVGRDFTEKGDRALLNLGHTIGHGVEFAAGVSHGQAVAIGLVAAAAVSERRCGFADGNLVRDTLARVGLPVQAPPVDRAEVIRLIGLDKKHRAGRLHMTLLEAVGRPVVTEVTDEDVGYGLEAIGL
ncbi:MAG: 3-dehydroquinate synthase family protein [Actinomycetes bacterium]|nr:3-dehydroquinate synthase [Acidimicrobiia bacterium]